MDLSAPWFYNIISSTVRERSIKEAKTNAVEYLTVNLKLVCFFCTACFHLYFPYAFFPLYHSYFKDGSQTSLLT